MMGNNALARALEQCIAAELTFAAFRVPGQSVEIWAQRDPVLEKVDGDLLWELNEVFLLLPFQVDRRQVAYIRSDVELYFGEIDPDIDQLLACRGAAFTGGALPGSTPKEEHLRLIGLARQAIQAGHLEKVVLARTFATDLERDALKDLFLRVCDDHPSAFAALIHDPEHGFWCGISPEQLVDEEEDRVTIDALAGTRIGGTAGGATTAWGAKEQHEQSVVRDHIVRTLHALRVREVQQTRPEVLQAGGVEHLHTRITADLTGHTLSELVLALHPTPAVCGSPTREAQDFIRTHEAHDRGLYAGAWGPWNPDGRTRLFVNIRCLQQRGRNAVLHAGGGITLGSDPEAEWRETEAKLRTLLSPIEALRPSR